MEGAQCFIEVFKKNNIELFHKPMLPIRKIKIEILHTKISQFKTIAVWYIKPKVKSLCE